MQGEWGTRDPQGKSEKQTNVLDPSHNVGDVAEDFVIPKAENVNIESPEHRVPLQVAAHDRLVRMNAAIHFDRQPNLRAVEIDNDRADSMLPTKFE